MEEGRLSIQEDEGKKALELIYNRYKDRLMTLPKEKGWLTETLCMYQGFWSEYVRVVSVVTTMAAQDNFQAQPTDIYLATLQKAGTTWLKALAFAILNRTTYENNPPSTHPLCNSNPHNLVPFIDTELLQTNPTYVDGHSPRLFATHIPYTSLPQSIVDSGCRVVYLCRNPKDVLVSLFHYANRLRDKSLGLLTFNEAFEMFSRGVSTSGPYWDHVKGYYKASLQHPKNIMFLVYEDMKRDTVNKVKVLAEFLGCPFTNEEENAGVVEEIIHLCSFENLKENNKHGIVGHGIPNNVFFREGKTGDWTNYLTDEMSQILDRITEKEFHGLNISF